MFAVVNSKSDVPRDPKAAQHYATNYHGNASYRTEKYASRRKTEIQITLSEKYKLQHSCGKFQVLRPKGALFCPTLRNQLPLKWKCCFVWKQQLKQLIETMETDKCQTENASNRITWLKPIETIKSKNKT